MPFNVTTLYTDFMKFLLCAGLGPNVRGQVAPRRTLPSAERSIRTYLL